MNKGIFLQSLKCYFTNEIIALNLRYFVRLRVIENDKDQTVNHSIEFVMNYKGIANEF